MSAHVQLLSTRSIPMTSVFPRCCCFSVAQLCLTLRPHGLQHARLPCSSRSLLKIYAHQVGDAIQVSHPLSSPSPPAFNFSQHRGLFQWVSCSHQVAKALELQFQHQSFQCLFRTDILRTDWFHILAVQGTQKSSPTPQFESISSLVLGFLYGSTITSIHNYWKNHSFDYMDFCRQSNVSVL